MGVACGGDDDAASDPPRASAGEVVSELARIEPSPDAPVAAVVRGIDDFAFEFQRLVASESENLVFSPASIATAFAMAHAGASEHTQATLDAAFGFPDESGIHEAMNALLRALAAAVADEVTLTVANSGCFEESGPPPPDASIRADRPFLYAIVHQPTGLILFTGHVADPHE